MGSSRMFCICSFIFLFVRISTSLDCITPNHSIRDGETIVSAGGTFELGFFSPGNSKNRYVGVWYKDIYPLTVVWVANREIPVSNASGVLKFNDRGVLLLLNATNSSVWSSSKSKVAENPVAQLLDSGNLVVKNGRGDTDEENILWQSFDHPCDTFLPGMKLGTNLVTGLDRFVSSWKTVDDPSEGEYMLKMDLRGYPQAVQTKGSVIKTRAGSWNGNGFTEYPLQKPNPVFKYYFVLNEKEVYYEYKVWNKSLLTRYTVNSFGFGQRFTWTRQTSSWELVATSPSDQCENYAVCGGYSTCSIGASPICACLEGFVPKKPEEWNLSYWSSGCVLGTKLDCMSDGFRKYASMKLPDTSSSWFSKTMSLDECRKLCLKNCSCTAYANLDIRDGGSGCLLWFDDLVDMRQFPQGGQDLYIRLPAPELDHVADNGHKLSKKKLLVGVAVGFVILVLGLIILGLTKDSWKQKLKSTVMAKIYKKQHNTKLKKEDMDLPTFDLSTISQATNNFSSFNKLGEGGYGPVYKGTLANGQELAVKRLSLSSGQGLGEFKNEVALIAKLQHRNLVKLLGCCMEGDEKLLIYEYMPNKSLDYFIFDQTRSKILDWPNRYRIIGGIARGLLYLHQDSRLRIIHRDLKTSNILLDGYMNPKISDFGLARAFEGEQVEANTNRVVGTYGYIPPEYAVHGHFSVKSDIFSFGVIILETVSGKKNRGFAGRKHYLNLLGHAWRLWNEERPLELTDEMLRETCTPSEVIRCIQVGLLCVQQRPEDRPDMSSVVLMLNGEKLLPNPKFPGFYTGGEILEVDSSSINYNPFSENVMSQTVLEAR